MVSLNKETKVSAGALSTVNCVAMIVAKKITVVIRGLMVLHFYMIFE